VSILPIRSYPDPVLRERCREVNEYDESLRDLVRDMVATMHAAPGVGLAASQVGVELRVAVVDLSVGKEPGALHVFVNPELRVPEGSGSEVETEGCLSIPDFTEKVSRPAAVEVEARDLHGEHFTLRAEGWLARAICHEVDHLDGVLFVDHLRGLRRERARRHLRRLAREWESQWSEETVLEQ
jgi:peptide deformylase